MYRHTALMCVLMVVRTALYFPRVPLHVTVLEG